jgi:hypothetical protein
MAISLTKVNELQDGPSFADAPKKHINFWEFIQSWEGGWMWEDIDFTQDTTQDLRWVAEGMQNNTLVWTTNRSYNSKRVTDLSGMGWIIFCSRTGLFMTGAFWEKPPSASLFRAEMLGLCTLHLLVQAVAEFFWHRPMGLSPIMQQQTSTGAVIAPPAKDTTKRKMR